MCKCSLGQPYTGKILVWNYKSEIGPLKFCIITGCTRGFSHMNGDDDENNLVDFISTGSAVLVTKSNIQTLEFIILV